ncbi:hypothetical protein A3A60_01395 [Candidatus Curtissbacteria bacterium RIFCSPLOWO2_01_FULL_42_26]|uniref:Peptidase M10 metallopeptidase domain-containing protein n=1 Tax=Candidatus Curtissbacteria bacterium RIFCSPLOWO2_01_FULL_42_26 TaxID=1797729 RepID=A0A1F5HYB9_9BACT|nr:MAG: hypothetical protein A3A60_01395 [Candidatus Curtissbacteria bacterium RIFCSPLOWO2_01_FULL_42_26]
MRQYIRVTSSILAILIALFLVITPVLAAREAAGAKEAAQAPEAPEVPEVDGTYDEPTARGIVKVRVIVHKQRQRVTTNLLVCDLADPDSNATVAAAGWHLPSNWTYNLNVRSVPSSVGGANLATIASNVFSDWQGAAGNKVSFSQGASTTVDRSRYDGKNIVAWGRTSGNTLGVTYIRYFTLSGLVVDVDTIMNKRVPWSWSNSDTCANTNSYDAENILTHEIGHWMGLDDHYDAAYVDNTMFGYGAKGEVKKNTLTTGDIAGVSAIYP